MSRWSVGWIGLLLVVPLFVLAACASAGTTPALPVPAPSRATLSAGAGSVVRTVASGGMSRTYLAISPSHEAGLPLLVVLHGREVTASQESERTGFLTYAQRGLVDLVYPQGTDNSWNDGHGCCGKAGAKGVDDIGFVAQVVADASRFFHSDPKRVYLVGYSNGGRLAFEEVCTHPALFTAFATFGALPPTECPTGPPVRALVGAGADDSIMHTEGSVTTAVARWRSRDGCGPETTTTHTGPLTLTTWTRCRDDSAVASAVYAGVGHLWPAAAPSRAPFTVAVGPGAAAATVMWNFLTADAA